MATNIQPTKRPVLVTTEYRGVFYGYAEDTSGESIKLADCRNAICWGTTKGFLELAKTGPTNNSTIGSKAPLVDLRKVTSVADVTPEAAAKWDALP